MAVIRKTKPNYYTDEDHAILRSLFTQYGDPNKARRFKYWEDVCEEFNSRTTSAKRNPIQIRGYFRLNKQKCQSYPFKAEVEKEDIVSSYTDTTVPLQTESLGSPPSKKPKSITASSSSGYGGSSSESQDEYRTLVDDLPKPWEYADISGNFLSSTNDPGGSSLGLDDRDEPHIFDDIDNFSMDRTTLTQDKNGMSSDLVNILTEQARQHHKLKIKLLKEKFRKVHDEHKLKMFILESELEMKRKEHDRKMDVLAQKYKKIKDSLEEQRI